MMIHLLVLLAIAGSWVPHATLPAIPVPRSAQAVRAEPRMVVPREVQRGDVLVVHISGQDLRRVVVRATLPHGRIVEVPAFLLGTGPHGLQGWQALVGLDHGLPGGDVLVEAAVQRAAEGADVSSEVLRAHVSLVQRPFLQERIRLTSALSALRQIEDPRRDAESAELYAVLMTINEDHRYHTGALALPIAGTVRITSGFGDRRTFLYADGGSARSVHNGIDFAAPTGTPVFAPGRGRVVLSTDRLITGHTIVMAHQPGLYSLFYHLDQRDVEEGELVEAGHPLGTVGSTGVSTGPHLHWEIRLAGASVDPAWFLSSPMVDTRFLAGALFAIP